MAVQGEAPTVMGSILFTKTELVLEQKGQRTFHFENSMPLKEKYLKLLRKANGHGCSETFFCLSMPGEMKNSVESIFSLKEP